MPQAAGFLVGALGFGASAVAGTAFAAGVTAGAAFAATTFGALLVRTVVGVGLSLLAQSLQPQPEIPKPSARMVNFAQPVVYAEYALGRVRKGGPIGFTGAAGKYRHYVPILAAHEIAGIVTHYLDEREAETDEAGSITTAPMTNKGAIVPFLGGAGQVASADLIAAFPGKITAAHDFAGLSGAYVKARKVKPDDFSKVYPTGRQWVYAPAFDGHSRIFDPRTGTRGHTRNAALILAWWLTEVCGQVVNWDLVAIEADHADSVILDRDGNPIPKWLLDGTISDDQDFETQRAQLCAACDAFLYETPDGEAGFYLGRYIAPEVTLDAGDFDAVEITGGQSGADAPTEIVPEYIEPENFWREFSGGVWTVSAEGRRVRDTPQLFMVSRHNQGQRIAKRLGRVKRAKWQLKGTIGAVGYDLLGKRFFRVQHAELGLDQVFEVGQLVREGAASFSITANSVDPEDFDFDAAAEEPDRPEIRAGEISDAAGAVDLISGVLAVSSGDGVLRVIWPAQDEVYSQQIRLTRLANGQETILAASGSAAGLPSFEIGGLVAGDVYSVQMRNFIGVPGGETSVGAWSPDPAAEVTIAGTVPRGAPAISEATAEPGRVRFRGVAGAATAGFRVYRSETDNFSAAVALPDFLPGSALAAFDVSAGDPEAVNILSDGDMSSGAAWTIGANWSISGGVATKAAGLNTQLSQSPALIAGTDYRVTYTAPDVSAGYVRARLVGAETVQGAAVTDPGTYAEILTAPSAPGEFQFHAVSTFAGSIDDAFCVPDSPSAVPVGGAYFWLVPVSQFGVEGTPGASHFLQVP